MNLMMHQVLLDFAPFELLPLTKVLLIFAVVYIERHTVNTLVLSFHRRYEF